jgi:YfiH family protein
LLQPQWPAPAHVRAFQSTRVGGVSISPFDSLNLGGHVGDSPEAVRVNRDRLFPAEDGIKPVWLQQVHGVEVLDIDAPHATPVADAAVSRVAGNACLVMTADCLPVLFCNRQGTVVAAAHAGWRGLCDGILEKTVGAMNCAPSDVLAWFGPAIGPSAFEVGEEVREAFLQQDSQHGSQAEAAFAPAKARGKWLGNLFWLARQRLASVGVNAVYGGEACTFSQPDQFFSYRRDGQTGRMVSAIWLE